MSCVDTDGKCVDQPGPGDDDSDHEDHQTCPEGSVGFMIIVSYFIFFVMLDSHLDYWLCHSLL